MNDHDISLIEQAYNCKDWGLMSALEEQAESEECKTALHNRTMDLYHAEEASAGQL